MTTRIYTKRVKHLHLPALSSGRSQGNMQLVQTWRRGEEKKRKKVDREKREEWRKHADLEERRRGREE